MDIKQTKRILKNAILIKSLINNIINIIEPDEETVEEPKQKQVEVKKIEEVEANEVVVSPLAKQVEEKPKKSIRNKSAKK